MIEKLRNVKWIALLHHRYVAYISGAIFGVIAVSALFEPLQWEVPVMSVTSWHIGWYLCYRTHTSPE